ncbi:VOC family protein [Angustibacter peucedani]
MSDRIRFDGPTVDAPDALALAQFYATITGGVATGTVHWAAASTPDGVIAVQQVEGYRPPEWPGQDVPAQLHLDFHVDDLEAAGRRVVAAGATLLAEQPNADHCLVYADPAGHPFCLSTWAGADLAAAAPEAATAPA